MARVTFTDFNKRLFVAGGRDDAPDGTLRRARGVAPELTGSVMSMYPPLVIYGIKALNLIRFNNQRYQFDGSILYKNGNSIATGFNGSRAALVTMPPALGLQDYLFIAGAGKLVKVAPDNNSTVTNWGIDNPPDQMAVTKIAQDVLTIDNFNASAGNWTTHNTAIANDAVEFQTGTGSLKCTPNAPHLPWFINTVVGYPKDFSKYGNGDISLPSDLITMWCNFSDPTKFTWMWWMFDVSDGTFKTDYYLAVIQLVQSSTNVHVAGANATFIPDSNRWIQLGVPKSSFQRVGTHLNKDWSNVVAVRIMSGLTAGATGPTVNLDQFQIQGGSPLGAGPAALSGGSEYEYFATFLNLVTGNRSNPQPDSAKVFGVALQNDALSQIPVSTDAQVGARELWRTSAENTGGGQTAFFLDTIYDNSTTTYTDKTADISIPITQTQWVASSAYQTGQLVDGGNGYYFKVTAGGGGNSGATIPAWVIPQSTWAPLAAFLINTTIAPRAANGHFFKVTVAGVSGRSTPNWAAGGTIVDGTITWVDQGAQTTTDNALTWTFQGVNSTPVLGTQAIQFDNIRPPATLGDAVGPYQGSMVWTRNSATGAKGNIYISPPGRAEGYGPLGAINVSTDNDPAQKAVIWQEQLWLFTVNAIYRMDGVYPNITPTKLYDHAGSIFPFANVSDKRGIYYRDQDAIHGMNYAGNGLVGFEQLSTILRNQPSENLPAFKPTFAAFAREEIYWSDETQVTLAMNLNPETGHAWRSFNVAMTALYYEEETGEIVASWNGVTGLWEHPTFIVTPGDNLLVTQVSAEVAMPNI